MQTPYFTQGTRLFKMCIIYLAFERHARYPLVLAANRDEFYDRPAAAAHNWQDEPNIFAGRDLVAGGTWLGITRDAGRFAAVTNYRDPAAPKGSVSRGGLVADFLREEISAEDYMLRVSEYGEQYSGFNLLAGEIDGQRREIFYYSNREGNVRKLSPGVYGLSNHLLDTPWPKVRWGKKRFKEIISSSDAPHEALFDLLSNRELADNDELPDTGIGHEKEKLLSAIFIKTPFYGTRCSNVLTIDAEGQAALEERVFV